MSINNDLFAMMSGIDFVEDYIDNIRVDGQSEPDVTPNGVLRDCLLLIVKNLRENHGIDFYVDDNVLVENFYDAVYIVDLYLNFIPSKLLSGVVHDGELWKVIRGLVDENADNILMSVVDFYRLAGDPNDYYYTDRYVWLQDKVKSDETFNLQMQYFMNRTEADPIDTDKYLQLIKDLNEQQEGLRRAIADMATNPEYNLSDNEYTKLIDFFRMDLKHSDQLAIVLSLDGERRKEYVQKIGKMVIDSGISDYRIVVEAIRLVSNYRLFGIPIEDDKHLDKIPLYHDTKELLLKHIKKVINVDATAGLNPENPDFVIEP